MPPAVVFTDVYKEYPFYQHITAGFKSFLFHLPKSIASLKRTKFVALKGISFHVEKGEVFGIIGRNGSGKSTILALAAGVMKPDRGIVRTEGKISSLLELGAGFHPELSGIENILLNGILSGNTRREMMGKMEEIIAFSELGDFVYQPLRTYSSGMHARLGFSVAVHVNPDILLVDEALAVGDLEFKEKCNKKMKEFMDLGTTVIVVSHDMPVVAEICTRVAWIESGTIMDIGSPGEVIKAYLNFLGLPSDFKEEESVEACGDSADEPVFDEQYLGEAAVETPDMPVVSAPAAEDGEISEQDLVHTVGPIHCSWWDSPVVMKKIEEFITGDSETDFYEYMKKEYSLFNLGKGLSVCRRLKGLEQSFEKYRVCLSFDVLTDIDGNEFLKDSLENFRTGQYDLLLCVDVLSHLDDIEVFVRHATRVLRDNGFLVALEYVGSPRFDWAEHEIALGDLFTGVFEALHNSTIAPNLHAEEYDTQWGALGRSAVALSSHRVIPIIERFFHIEGLRFFGGPFCDLVLNKVLHRLDQTRGRDVMLIEKILECEQDLIRKGIIRNHYAMIIGKKRVILSG